MKKDYEEELEDEEYEEEDQPVKRKGLFIFSVVLFVLATVACLFSAYFWTITWQVLLDPETGAAVIALIAFLPFTLLAAGVTAVLSFIGILTNLPNVKGYKASIVLLLFNVLYLAANVVSFVLFLMQGKGE